MTLEITIHLHFCKKEKNLLDYETFKSELKIEINILRKLLPKCSTDRVGLVTIKILFSLLLSVPAGVFIENEQSINVFSRLPCTLYD